MSVSIDIAEKIAEARDNPLITRRQRSGSQMLYKDCPIKFLGNDGGTYKIARLDTQTGEWIPESVTSEKYKELLHCKHRKFKYSFSERLMKCFSKVNQERGF